MKLAIITPVGPGHELLAKRAMASVQTAIELNPGPWREIVHKVVDDTEGRYGRSAARNAGMDAQRDADWYFFLDADDTLFSTALTRCDFTTDATFGAIWLAGQRYRRNVYPCGWPELLKFGCVGTLTMGCFVRASIAKRLRFAASLDAGEDFEFFTRLPSFTKHSEPLVDIGYDEDSAAGPRGYTRLDWGAACAPWLARLRAEREALCSVS